MASSVKPRKASDGSVVNFKGHLWNVPDVSQALFEFSWEDTDIYIYTYIYIHRL